MTLKNQMEVKTFYKSDHKIQPTKNESREILTVSEKRQQKRVDNKDYSSTEKKKKKKTETSGTHVTC